MKFIYFFITFLLAPTLSIGASFDCEKASTKHEKKICLNEELNNADSKMGEYYKKAKIVNPEFIKTSQKEFNKIYKQCNLIDDCIKLVNGRNAKLSGYIHYCIENETFNDQKGMCSFSSKVIDAVKNNDMESFLQLINPSTKDGELEGGPLKSELQGKSFSDIFSDETIKNISEELNAQFDQEHYAYFLDGGEIWIDHYKGKWTIFSINTKVNDITASECNKDDQDYADFWKNYYEPEDAYNFGIKIQNLVAKEDLEGIFSLVEGELEFGPKKDFIKNKSFSDLFDEKWKAQVLKNKPSCRPQGWRGFFIGDIWFDKSDSGWKIFMIHGAKKMKINNEKITGWSYDGKILHPQCFQKYWDSADNYQEYYEQFTGIKKDYFRTREYEDFTFNIGKYWGKEITTFKPINTGWGGEHELLELAVSMKSCLNKKTKVFEVLDDRVTSQTAEPKNRNEYFYKEIKKIPLETCQSLAPNIKGKCIQSYLLEIGEWGGGNMGYTYEWSIFGLFKLSNDDEYIFPLKRFNSQEDALNYEI